MGNHVDRGAIIPLDTVLDPFLGTGTSVIAAIRHGRRGAGAETFLKYVKTAHARIKSEINGTLRTRPMHKPVYDPVKAGNSLKTAPWQSQNDKRQMVLFEKQKERERHCSK